MALRLAVEITGEAGGLREGVQAAGRSIDNLAERGQRMARELRQSLEDAGRRMRALGQRLSLAVTAPVGFAALSVKTASEMQELRNLISVTFGEATADVEAWATRTAAEVQRSRMELLRAAGDFAAFLKPLGVAGDAVAPMSQALTQLTTDLSSFRNIAEEDVFTALFSGLAGETEAVRRLGIDLGQAALDAELLAMGIEGGARAASQAEKVVARFNLIMAQTTDAQGDAARTAGSFENQTRALGAAMTDLRVAVGTVLLPIATELVATLSDIVRSLSEVNPTLLEFGVIGTGIAAALGPVILGFGLLATAAAAISAPVWAAIVGIGVLTTAVIAFWPEIKAAWQAVKEGFSAVADFVSQPLSDIVAQSRDFLVDQLGGVWETVKSGLQAVRSVFVAVFGEEVVAAFEAFHVAIFNTAVQLVAGLKDTIVGGLEWIRDRVTGIWEGVVGIFQWGQDVIVGNSIVPDMVEAVLAWFGRMGEGMTGSTGAAAEGVVGQFAGMRAGVDTTLAGLGTSATSPFRSIADAITGPFQDALTEGQFSFKSFGESLIASADQLADRIINDAFKRINDAIVNLLSGGSGGFGGGGGGGGGGAGGFLGGLIGGLFGGGGGAAGGGFNFAANTGGLYALGGVFDRGRVVPFANGAVIDRPTLFPMAQGAGLMAEEGPEAIMPLVRLPSGRLGVEAGGRAGAWGEGRASRQFGDTNVTVNVSGVRDGPGVRQSGLSVARETARAVRRAQRGS